MNEAAVQTTHERLPVTGSLKPAYFFSLVAALLMAGLSTAGLVFRTSIYPTDELLQSFLTNDVVNLVIGLPFLLLSMWWAGRGRLIGLLFWPGALLYVLYNYLVYVLALPLGAAFVLCLVLLAVSLYTTIGLVAAIDSHAVQQRLAGAVRERLAGGLLAVLGILIALFSITGTVQAVVSGTSLPAAEVALHITDFLISPAWFIGGVLLWRRRAAGYAMGLGLLFQGSMLFVGLIVFLLLQPILTGAPFAPVDVVVTFIMGLAAFIPFALFVRGVVARQRR
jgi:hypothetical protein